MGQRGQPVAVADGVEPAARDADRAQPLVDLDGRPGSTPTLSSPTPGSHPPAGGDEQLVADELLAIGERDA